MKTLRYILLCCFLTIVLNVLFLACQREPEMDDFSGKLMVELREVFNGEERQMALYVVTLEEYPCANFQIAYTYTHVAGRRMIIFEGIELSEACITAFGPARTFIGLGDMQEGSHDVHMEINRETIITSFEVKEDLLKMSVLGGYSPYLDFYEKVMHRLSAEHVWGYVHAKMPGAETDYSDFFAQLWQAQAEEETLPPGNYGFFRIGEEYFVLFDHIHHYMPENPIVIRFDGDFQVLREIALEFSEEYVIALYSGKGDVFLNQ